MVCNLVFSDLVLLEGDEELGRRFGKDEIIAE